MTTVKLEYYKTNVGTFFRQLNHQYYYDLSKHLINDIPATNLPKYPGNFYKVDGEIKSVKYLVPATSKLSHYELINPELASDKIPLTISVQDASKEYNDDIEEYQFTGAYASIMSLYTEKYEKTESTLADAELEMICLGELHIDNLTKPEEVKVKTIGNSGAYGNQKATEIDLKSVVKYDDLLQMIVPEFMLHNHPCELSSKQVYQIVRQHIIENINPKVATLSSNYDFCLTVKKIVTVKPYDVKSEQLTPRHNSYKPPRFKTTVSNTKAVEIFEMTWAGYKGTGGYDGYTCIPAWKANNFAELVDNMRQYLDELMEVINMPVHECTTCNGTGHIFTSLVAQK